MNEIKGLFGSLFDLSFSELVTTKIVKILYIIAIVLSGLTALSMIIMSFVDSAPVLLILSPIVLFFLILFARISLEFIIVVFKIAENTSYLVNKDSNG